MVNKQTLATLFQRFPWLAKGVVQTYRLTRSRYTAGVNGVLFDEQGRILMVQHVFHPKFPWGLPGGWVERMEEPADTVQREFWEETHLQVRVVRPILIQKGQFFGSHLDVAFWVESLTPLAEIQLSSELTDYAWCTVDKLPPLNPFNQRVIETAIAQGMGK